MAEKANGEAGYVFFIDPPLQHPSGLRVHITFREGATEETVAQAFNAVDLVAKEAQARGYAGTWKKPEQPKATQTPAQPQAQTPAQPSTPRPPSGHRWRTPKQEDEAGTADVARLKITGTEDAPTVEMYSPVASLKYPFFKPPFTMVRDFLINRYGDHVFTEDALRLLGTCGKVHQVEWEVDWVRSEKNASWLDVKDIRVKKLEAEAKDQKQREGR